MFFLSAMVISGCVGPKGDGYEPEELLDSETARAYHGPQIEAFAASRADIVTGVTIKHSGEAIGIVQAARDTGVPVAIYSRVLKNPGRERVLQQLASDADKRFKAPFRLHVR